jgi:hypothetical protein
VVRVHPLKKPGAWPKNLRTWGHKLQGISMNSQDPLHVLGQGHSKPGKPPSLPLFSPLHSALLPCQTSPRSTRNISPSPLLRWRVRLQAQSSSFQTPEPISFQRQRHGSGDQQRWHRAANASISDSRGAANSKGVPAIQSADAIFYR